jgi:hypothetical protein
MRRYYKKYYKKNFHGYKAASSSSCPMHPRVLSNIHRMNTPRSYTPAQLLRAKGFGDFANMLPPG